MYDVMELLLGGGGKFKNNYTLTQINNINTVYNYLTKTKKLTPVQAAAIMGNVMLESSFYPDSVLKGGDKAVGFLQMHGDLYLAYQNYLKEKNLKHSITTPFDYVIDMINGVAPHSYTKEYYRVFNNTKPNFGKTNLTGKAKEDMDYYNKTYGNRVKTNTLYLINDLLKAWNNPKIDLKTLTSTFTNVIERAGKPEYDKRHGYAQEYYDYYNSYKKGGKMKRAFIPEVNVLDSDPTAYKYVKKKYKMRSAAEGMKFSLWLNSDTGLVFTNLGMLLWSGIQNNYFLNKVKKDLEQWKSSYLNSLEIPDFTLLATKLEYRTLLDGENASPISIAKKNWDLLQQYRLKMLALASIAADLLILNLLFNLLKLTNSGWGDILSTGLGIAGQFLSKKNDNSLKQTDTV